jgi:MFS family permease
MTQQRGQARFFYGWWLVVLATLIQAVGFGTSLYLYSVLAGSLEQEFPSGRFMLMMGASGLFLATALMSPLIGRLLDPVSISVMVTLGALVMGAGFVLMAFATHIWQVIVLYTVFIAAGMATLSPLTTSTLLSRWFDRHRGLALGIAALGTQLGGLAIPPLMAYFIELYDWRQAVIVLGVAILIFGPLLARFGLVDHPHQKGLEVDGDTRPRTLAGPGAESAPLASPGFRLLFRERNFLLLVAIIGALSAVNVGLLSNLSLFAIDIGESPARAALLISLLAVLGMIASPLTGRLCDVFNIRLVAALVVGCMAIALVVFTVANHYTVLLLATFFHGLAGGAIVPLWAALVARLYDVRIFGSIMGSATLVVFSAIAVAPPFAGWIHDFTGSYRLLYLIFLGAMLLALLLVTRLQVPASHRDKFMVQAERASQG